VQIDRIMGLQSVTGTTGFPATPGYTALMGGV
jgi:hypothetical protein